MTVAEDIHRVTVDEYIRIVRDFGWEATELIEGVVYDVTPEFSRHTSAVMRVFRMLDTQFPDETTFNAGSVRLSQLSIVDPDAYVVEIGAQFEPDDAIPVSAVKLIVEVSVTTQARDRGAKLIAYAKAGVPEVWLIDPRPEAGELVRYRDPEGASYRSVARFDVGENARDLDVKAILER